MSLPPCLFQSKLKIEQRYVTQREEKGMAMVHGTQRTKRKEKNEVAKLRRAETREKIGEGPKVREKKLKQEG